MANFMEPRKSCRKTATQHVSRRKAPAVVGGHTRPRLGARDATEFYAYLTLITGGTLVFTDNAVVAWRKAKFRNVARMEADPLRLAQMVVSMGQGCPNGIFDAARQSGLS